MSAITQLQPDRSGSPDPVLLLAAVQAFPGSLAVADCGVVLYANAAWAQMFEYANPSQIQGRPVEDFIPKRLFQTPIARRNDPGRKDSGQNDHRWRNPGWSNERGVCSTAEFLQLRRDGSRVELQVACAGFRLRGREFQVYSARETRPQKQAGLELREAQRLEAVGRLASGVAHDFNNLLTGIMLYCDLLIAELGQDSRSHQHARQIRMAGEHGARLVQQLLAVARPQALEVRVFALNEVVAGIEQLLSRLIGDNIVLATSLAGDLGVVRMDPVHVQQILLNLVLNARDAMPEGGQITLATRNCTDYLQNETGHDERPHLVPCVELSVSDTGCGMDTETLNRAFEPFFTTKRAGQGNGLGLATACRLAKLEGGTIRAESQPGRGTRVALLLPRVNQDRVFGSASSSPGGFHDEGSDSKSSGRQKFQMEKKRRGDSI